MRKVAGYAMFSAILDGSAALSRFDAASQCVTDWLREKGEIVEESDSAHLRLSDGRVAEYVKAEYEVSDGKVVDHTVIEPTTTAIIRTQVSVALANSRVIAYIELQAAGGAYQLGPMNIDIRSPRIVRTLVSSADDWQVGDAPLSVEPFRFEGALGGRRLEAVIWHPRRNLPVVAISSYEGSYLTDYFPNQVASDLVGVAIVGTVDHDAAWELTSRRGKGWSSFNGAIRLYWPSLNAASTPLRNPLWTRSSLLVQATAPEDAASRFKRQLRRMLLGLSAYAVPEPSDFAKLRKAHADDVALAARTPLRDGDDWKGLAESYAEENETLRTERDHGQSLIRELEAQLANLQLSLRWRVNHEAEIEPEVNLPPSTVGEAVDDATRRFADQLVFGDDVADGVRGVAADAGPPEKILQYFEHLAEMTRLRQTNALGTSPIKWLQERGVHASGESETIKSSSDERKKRSWHDGRSRRAFDLHLKPTDATQPDRCVRIYFDYDDDRKIGVVGWVGRHP